MVAFLSKPTESDGLEQIVDFLNANPIKYALTANPTIYVSCIEQFWYTVVSKTINGEAQIHDRVDGKKVIISEASIRRVLQFAGEEGVDCLPNSTIFEQLASMSAKTTAWNEFSSSIASAVICLATGQKFNFSKYIFDSMVKNLDSATKILMFPRAATTDSSLEAEQDNGNINRTQSKATPNESSSQGTDSRGGLRMVKKLERRNKLRTHKLKRLYKVGLTARLESLENEESLSEHASKQGRRIDDIDADEDITLAKGVVIQEPSESPTTTTTITKQKSQDNGKGILVEEPVKLKKKDQIRLDEEVALKLQAEFDEEQMLSNKHELTISPNVEVLNFSPLSRAFKRVNTFELIRSELVEGKEKRAGEEVIQESSKKQKVDNDKETVELNHIIEIIQDKEEVAIDAIPLAVKSPRMIDWKIYKEGKKSYYQIIRADGKLKMHMFFSQMLTSFDKEDLEDLYKLVKAKYESTRPVEDLDLLIWGDLKKMFESHVEDVI
nr:hypothetical protein [Tanacetum cinerariifolium]